MFFIFVCICLVTPNVALFLEWLFFSLEYWLFFFNVSVDTYKFCSNFEARSSKCWRYRHTLSVFYSFVYVLLFCFGIMITWPKLEEQGFSRKTFEILQRKILYLVNIYLIAANSFFIYLVYIKLWFLYSNSFIYTCLNLIKSNWREWIRNITDSVSYESGRRYLKDDKMWKKDEKNMGQRKHVFWHILFSVS